MNNIVATRERESERVGEVESKRYGVKVEEEERRKKKDESGGRRMREKVVAVAKRRKRAVKERG